MTPVSSRMDSGSIQRSGRSCPSSSCARSGRAGCRPRAARRARPPSRVGRDVERLDELRRARRTRRSRSNGRAAPASLITSAVSSIVSKWPLPSAPLTTPRHALARHAAAEAFGHEVDELLAAQDALHVGRIHRRLLGAGQTEPGAADDDRAARDGVAVGTARAVLARRAAWPREQLREPFHGSDAGAGGSDVRRARLGGRACSAQRRGSGRTRRRGRAPPAAAPAWRARRSTAAAGDRPVTAEPGARRSRRRTGRTAHG